MSERGLIGVVFGSVTLVTLVALAGHGPFAGPVLVGFTSRHGVNVGDLVPLLAWASAGVACWHLWRRVER